MDKHKMYSVILAILKKVDNGIIDIDPDDFGIDYEEFKFTTSYMHEIGLINGSETFYDGLLNYETAFITTKGKKYLKDNS